MGIPIPQSVVLVGLMGCGKSSVGIRLAKRLGLPFKDTDHEIEAQVGCSISMLFEVQGEDYFRKREFEVVERLLSGPPCVIATGGGAFIQEPIRTLVKEKGLSIWLRAELDVLLERVSRKRNRPLLERGDKSEILRRLMDERYPIYAEADITVDSNPGPHIAVVEQIVETLKLRYPGLYITESIEQ